MSDADDQTGGSGDPKLDKPAASKQTDDYPPEHDQHDNDVDRRRPGAGEIERFTAELYSSSRQSRRPTPGRTPKTNRAVGPNNAHRSTSGPAPPGPLSSVQNPRPWPLGATS
jgi:hypothetical protein